MKQIALVNLAFLLLFMAAAGSAIGQSRERDHPKPLRSDELRGDLDGSGDEYFYSFGGAVSFQSAEGDQ